jgi:hypothetical protein
VERSAAQSEGLGHVRSCYWIVLAGLMLITPAAFADCQPPPPGLSFQAWQELCSNEITNAYQRFGAGMDYSVFVPSLYQMYVQASSGGAGAGGVPYATGPCSSPGQTYCNASGWLLTCNGSQWLTGAVQCQ